MSYPKYLPSFKLTSVLLAKKLGSVSKAAQRLKLSYTTLYKWCNLYEAAGAGQFFGNRHPLVKENKRLQSDIDSIQERIDRFCEGR